MSSPKVFCIGFQKTGTTSLYAALTELGYRTAAVVGRDFTAAELRDFGAQLCIETAEKYDAAQDMPWPVFFRELDAAYPNSKFILTVRDSDSWFASLENHFGAAPNAMQEFVYGAASPSGNRERFLAVYEAHEQAVRAHFARRPDDLLIMDLKQGHGWDELCAFLGRPVPDSPFPAKNRSEDRQTLRYRVRRRLSMIAGKYLAPEQI
ncbi:MAG: sulfotransferase family protein [Pseudomonadota bacterium]